MTMSREQFEYQLAVLLRHHGAGTTADLTDELVAYWNGSGLSFALLRETPTGSIHEEFCMDDAHWGGWRSWLEAWIDSPMFSVRPEIRDWVSKKPFTDARS